MAANIIKNFWILRLKSMKNVEIVHFSQFLATKDDTRGTVPFVTDDAPTTPEVLAVVNHSKISAIADMSANWRLSASV